jgi:protein-disulfide isomerase-like protein with CxxC motif
MTAKTSSSFGSSKSLTILSALLLGSGDASLSVAPGQDAAITEISRAEFEDLLALANSNHVVMRGLEAFRQITSKSGNKARAEWAATAIAAEGARIENATSFLRAICDAFEAEGHDITVIKSLDHWPDLGSDLDLYTNTDPAVVLDLMTQRFQAEIAPRSWGDRLANKWNFNIPGLPEAVEIHMGRLGQTGEQIAIASSLAWRARLIEVGRHTFRVPAVSDRLMISTLQRMYRHFYFRLCDIVDSASLCDTGAIDYQDLRASAQAAGIWEGVATYLVIVSDYVEHYRGKGLDLPTFVRTSARFGGDKLHFRRDFLRVPIMPESAALYASQLTTLLRNREFKNSARLSLLPYLATVAAVGMKITGSDKGIW